MSNTVFQLRRNSVTGTRPLITNLQPGELAVNLTDGLVFSSNGTVVFEIGANNTNVNITGNAAINAIIANGSIGSANQFLVSNGSGIYWSIAGPANINTAAQFIWSNTHTFQANVQVNAYFTVANTSANVFYVNTSNLGNIGIRTSTPQYALDVNDTIRATGNLYTNNTLVVGNNVTNTTITSTSWNIDGTVYANSSYITVANGIFLQPQTSVAPNTSEGSVFYDITNHALNVYADDSSTPLEIGQQELLRVVNKTGSTLTLGSAVYINGAQGNRPTVALAQANSIPYTKVIGIVASSSGILNNAEGFVLSYGLLQGVNTNPYSTGDTLYVSATTPGALTSTQPSYPNYNISVGYALNSTNNGKMFINIQRTFLAPQPNTNILISNGTNQASSNNLNFDYANNVLYIGNSSSNASIGYFQAGVGQSYLYTQSSVNTSVETSIVNYSTGNNAGSDYIAYDAKGITSNNYIDIGINGNGYSQATWTINGPSDGYLYTGNTNLSIGTQGPNYLNFFTGNTLIANERMRITATGNVGIGNTAPDATLKVTGTANVSGNVIIGGALTSANVTSSLFTGNVTGTASNATNLNSQPGSYYTNATNITTGTLPYAQLGANVVNTSANFTITGLHTFTANVTANSNLLLSTYGSVMANSYTFTNSLVAANVDTFAVATYRSVEYVMQLADTTLATPSHQITKLLIVHDGTTTFMTEYGTISTHGTLGTFTSGITTGTLYVQLTPLSSNVICKFVRTTLLA